MVVVERAGSVAREVEAEAVGGLSTRTFFRGEGEPGDERGRLIVVVMGGNDGPTRGEGGGA